MTDSHKDLNILLAKFGPILKSLDDSESGNIRTAANAIRPIYAELERIVNKTYYEER